MKKNIMKKNMIMRNMLLIVALAIAVQPTAALGEKPSEPSNIANFNNWFVTNFNRFIKDPAIKHPVLATTVGLTGMAGIALLLKSYFAPKKVVENGENGYLLSSKNNHLKKIVKITRPKKSADTNSNIKIEQKITTEKVEQKPNWFMSRLYWFTGLFSKKSAVTQEQGDDWEMVKIENSIDPNEIPEIKIIPATENENEKKLKLELDKIENEKKEVALKIEKERLENEKKLKLEQERIENEKKLKNEQENFENKKKELTLQKNLATEENYDQNFETTSQFLVKQAAQNILKGVEMRQDQKAVQLDLVDKKHVDPELKKKIEKEMEIASFNKKLDQYNKQLPPLPQKQKNLSHSLFGIDLQSELLDAIKNNDTTEITRLITAEGANVNAKTNGLLPIETVDQKKPESTATFCCLFANGAEIPKQKDNEPAIFDMLRSFETGLSENKDLIPFVNTYLADNKNVETILEILCWQTDKVVEKFFNALDTDPKTYLNINSLGDLKLILENKKTPPPTPLFSDEDNKKISKIIEEKRKEKELEQNSKIEKGELQKGETITCFNFLDPKNKVISLEELNKQEQEKSVMSSKSNSVHSPNNSQIGNGLSASSTQNSGIEQEDSQANLQYDLLNAVDNNFCSIIPELCGKNADINALYDRCGANEDIEDLINSTTNIKPKTLMEIVDPSNISMICCLFGNGATVPEKCDNENPFFSTLRDFKQASDQKDMTNFVVDYLGTSEKENEDMIENWGYILDILFWQTDDVIANFFDALSKDPSDKKLPSTEIGLENGLSSIYLRLFGKSLEVEDLKQQQRFLEICKNHCKNNEKFKKECTDAYEKIFKAGNEEEVKNLKNNNTNVVIDKISQQVEEIKGQFETYKNCAKEKEQECVAIIKAKIEAIADLLIQAQDIDDNFEKLNKMLLNKNMLGNSILNNSITNQKSFICASAFGKSFLNGYLQNKNLTASIMNTSKLGTANKTLHNDKLKKIQCIILKWCTDTIKKFTAEKNKSVETSLSSIENNTINNSQNPIIMQSKKLKHVEKNEKKEDYVQENESMYEKINQKKQHSTNYDSEEDSDDENEWDLDPVQEKLKKLKTVAVIVGAPDEDNQSIEKNITTNMPKLAGDAKDDIKTLMPKVSNDIQKRIEALYNKPAAPKKIKNSNEPAFVPVNNNQYCAVYDLEVEKETKNTTGGLAKGDMGNDLFAALKKIAGPPQDGKKKLGKKKKKKQEEWVKKTLDLTRFDFAKDKNPNGTPTKFDLKKINKNPQNKNLFNNILNDNPNN